MSGSRLYQHPLRNADQLLMWAFVISLVTHLVLYGGFQLGHHYGWWHRDLMPDWLKPTKQLMAEINKRQPNRPIQEAPLLFVEVDPTVMTADAPKDAKYYSSHNSKAANAEATIDTQTPKIDGSQDKVPKTETAQRAKAFPLQPSPPKPQPEPETAETKPKGGQEIGDLAMAKPATQPGEEKPKTPAHERPRTLAEAQAQKALTGEKMKQDGGVKRHLDFSSLDARATPFGEYDRQLIEAIQNRWYDLLDSKNFSRDRTGKVVIEFNLNYDGTVTDMKIIENDVDDLLGYVCQKAITDPAPYMKWPSDMRRLMGGDVREVRFTFFYE